MKKSKRCLSVALTSAMVTSAFSAFAIIADAENANSGVIFTPSETCKNAIAVKAAYKTNGELDGVTFENVKATAGEELKVEAEVGTKVMLWNNLKDAKPIDTAKFSKAFTSETEKEVVYIDEKYEYEAGTVISSTGNSVDKAPDPVQKGNIIYSAGHRNNGAINTTSSITENGTFKVTSDNYSTNSRGISFEFAETAGIPKISEIDSGSVLEMSFDITATQNFTVKDFGDITKEDLTTTTDAVHVRAILDKDANKQYLIVSDASGAILNSKVANLTATSFSGMSFFAGTGTFEIDNLKVEKKTVDVAIVTLKAENSLEDVEIVIDSAKFVTSSDGTAVIALPNGTYTATASKNGYEHTANMGDNDVKTITVNNNAQEVIFKLSIRKYVALPEEVTIGNGQTFIAAPKSGDAAVSEKFTVTVKDQFGIELTDDEYTLEWNIYPAGTTTPDPNVTVNDGIVSVSNAFKSEDMVAAYDLTVAAFTDDRNNKVSTTVYVGNNDIIYYEPIKWQQSGGTGNRNSSINFAENVTLPDMSAVSMDVNFTNGTEAQRTIAIVTDAGNLVGLQLAGTTIKAWTGWNGNKDMNQYNDIDKFDNGAVLVENYENGTKLNVTFVIDKTTNNITVSCGSTSVSLPYTISPKTLTGFKAGQYRNYGAFNIGAVTVQEPDQNYLSIIGDVDFAKVSGTVIQRTYELGQSVLVPDETFEWSVSPSNQGVGITNEGVLTVADTAAAGTYTITVTSTTNEAKTADLALEIGDFQEMDELEIVGPRAYEIGAQNKASYKITGAKDKYGDDVTELLPEPTWSSSNTNVATINEHTGEITIVNPGNTEITATIANGTVNIVKSINVTVAAYSLTGDANGAATVVNTSSLVSDASISEYLVTTATTNGVQVKSEKVAAAQITSGSYTVDTTGADKYEISPIYSYAIGVPGQLGVYGDGFDIAIPSGTYNFEITNNGGRSDVYANNQILVNNILQGGSAVKTVEAKDIVINEGVVKISTTDYASGKDKNSVDISVKIVKSPSIVNRVTKMYVIGDSLVCTYYNGADATKNYQTGWGQVLGNYTKDVDIVNLANSGATANGLKGSAFTQVLASAKSGDYLLIESGYNDRTYDSESVMKNALKFMIEEAEKLGVKVVLISPNASAHTYGSSVAWTGFMEDVATETETDYIDLSQLSYDFFQETYAGDKSVFQNTYNVSDKLHSTYHGANKWASIVAQGLYDLGYSDIINTEYSYSFVDANNTTILCGITVK